jgi:hypothetical protein
MRLAESLDGECLLPSALRVETSEQADLVFQCGYLRLKGFPPANDCIASY